jgi:hypothetical protein
MFNIRPTVRELAFTAVSASLWISAQIALGPSIGRFSFGPVSMHGAVNHVVGWFLMVVTAALLRKFGMVSIMASVAAVGTRMIRVSALEGMLAGLGYICAGVFFDILFFSLKLDNLRGFRLRGLTIFIAASSGVSSLIPYLFFRLYVAGPAVFTTLVPLYILSIIKNIFFSSAGAYLALLALPRLTSLYMQQAK